MAVMAEVRNPVDWAYDVWDEAVEQLGHKDNHNRAIAAQLLCGLAKSDPKNRLKRDFALLFAVTSDERFVTARHCLQALWKVGVVGKGQRKMLVTALEDWFVRCTEHKNCPLIRYDICESLRKVYDATGDDTIKDLALRLIATEVDDKYRKKYLTLWLTKSNR